MRFNIITDVVFFKIKALCPTTGARLHCCEVYLYMLIFLYVEMNIH